MYFIIIKREQGKITYKEIFQGVKAKKQFPFPF